MTIDIGELERQLRDGDRHPGRPDLAAIRESGARRRRTRRLVTAGAAVATVSVLAGVGLGGAGLLDRASEPDRGSDPASHATAEPTELSPLAKRALADIPGAEQVSDWQVVIPGPGRAPGMSERLGPERFAGPREPLGRWYTGVTMLPKSAYPAWLWRGTQEFEKSQGSKGEGYPVGSTDTGVIVDIGAADLACMKPWDYENQKVLPGRCHPAMVGNVAGRSHYLWGMGTDDFMKPGAPMELFNSEDYTEGRERAIWRGGVAGTDVARVEFEMPDGEVVDGTVAAGTFVPGATMFWVTLAGEPATVRTYDAAGTVLETHHVKPCGEDVGKEGVDCEVR